jgi:uncharacterized protein (UPF0261 family)
MSGVLLIATMDTKGQEALYLRDRIKALGQSLLIMDLSMKGGHRRGSADIPAHKVARAGGTALKQIHHSQDLDHGMSMMTAGAVKIVRRLVKEGKVSGVIGIGGYRGSLMATAVMHALPFGFPKIMVSSAAALPGLSTRFLKTSDIVLFHSVIEIAGLTFLLRNVLDRAASALCGMLSGTEEIPTPPPTKTIAMTMFGPCEKCARTVRASLEKSGYQVIGFHAAGIGDRAMEDMVTAGLFGAVIDLAPGGLGEHLYGFMRDAGPYRLESAGKKGIPQVISTCGVNHITPTKSRYKPTHTRRRKFDLDRFRTWLRMSPKELKEVARLFSRKLNQSTGPVQIVVPLRGWSSVDSPGMPTYDPTEDALFIRELRKGLKKGIDILEIDANMEDPEFAEAVIKATFEVLQQKTRNTGVSS